jgi:antitoxin component YwqK of YwqJK toxin-antitoxin module
MKFLGWFISFLFISAISRAQELPNSFKIGEFVEVFHGDSLSMFFDCTGRIIKKPCATYYREGKIYRTEMAFDGPVKDYYISGKKAFEGQYQKGGLTGKAVYYYENGNVSETGFYVDNARSGVWKFFYPDGSLEKVINFIDQEPLLVSYIDSAKAVKIINGNGVYNGLVTFGNCSSSFKVAGELKDGRMHGEWKLYNPFINKIDGKEIFVDGQFVKGTSVPQKGFHNNYPDYTDFPRARIFNFQRAEYLRIDESQFSPCLKTAKGKPIETSILRQLRYNGSWLSRTYYPELVEKLQAALPENVQDQWLIVGLKIEKSDELSAINVSSSINDNTVENILLANLTQMNKWSAAVVNKVKFGDSHYFAVLVKNGKVSIPFLNYIYSPLNIIKKESGK